MATGMGFVDGCCLRRYAPRPVRFGYKGSHVPLSSMSFAEIPFHFIHGAPREVKGVAGIFSRTLAISGVRHTRALLVTAALAGPRQFIVPCFSVGL